MAHTLPSHPSAPTCRELRAVALANMRMHIELVSRSVGVPVKQFHWKQALLYAREAHRWHQGAATAARRG